MQGWPVAWNTFRTGVACGLPDRLCDASGVLLQGLADCTSFEASGIEDWRSRATGLLVPSDRALAVWASGSTWRLTKLSRWRKSGREALVQGLRWGYVGGMVFATFPREASKRATVFESLGYDDEWSPEFLFVPHGSSETWNREYLVSWCQERELWRDPAHVIPTYAERAIAFFNGWMHIAADAASAAEVRQAIELLARKWAIPILEGRQEWAWLH